MWLYKGEEITDEDIPVKAIGFIYMLTYKPTGQRYIGRKLLTKVKRRQKNKRIYRTRVESDWKDYWSSSPEIKSIIDEQGTEVFKREILLFTDMKGKLNYLEEKLLYYVGALETTQWLNSNIRSKFYKRNIIDKIDTDEVNQILLTLTSNEGTK